jgi:hypothetical protein
MLSSAEFARNWIGRLFGDHLQAGRESVTCANCTSKQVERFREPLFESAQALLPQIHHNAIRSQPDADSDQQSDWKHWRKESNDDRRP